MIACTSSELLGYFRMSAARTEDDFSDKARFQL
jgi:hypothetical protein